MEEPGALVELGARWGDVGILLEGLKVGRERKNCWRMTSSKRGFPYDILSPSLVGPPSCPGSAEGLGTS